MEERCLKVGVVGIGRGRAMIRYANSNKHCKLVAICDNWEEGLARIKADMEKQGKDIAFYADYDEFLTHDMDVVILANYATEHAPFAVKALKKGFHVMSECLPVQTMAEAVALVEAVEESGKKYCFMENACYAAGTMEMKRLYKEGTIGEFEYGEGEYCHNCEGIWTELTHGGDPNHWRNTMQTTFYCTHSTGPLISVTGLRPVSVVGMEMYNHPRMRNMGRMSGLYAIELIRMENGGIYKSLHGELYSHSSWYNFYGSKGRMETCREDVQMGDTNRVCLDVFKVPGDYKDPDNHITLSYMPKDQYTTKARNFGHSGSDFYCLWNAIEHILGNPEANAIDVYQALDMCMPGIFAHFSHLEGSKELKIPNMRDPKEREAYRNDHRCTNPEKAGDQVVPAYSWDTPPIEQEVWDRFKADWEAKGHPNTV